MGNLVNDEEVEPTEGVLHHEDGIDLRPGNIELSGLEVSLVKSSANRFLNDHNLYQVCTWHQFL